MATPFKPKPILALLILLTLATAVPSHAQIDVWPDDLPAYIDAFNALRADDIERAKTLFEEVLVANPNDGPSWYNYACILARLGEDSSALRALEASIVLEFYLPEWYPQDEDLANLRKYPKYTELTERAARLLAEQHARPGGIRWLTQKRAACYELHLPEGYDRETAKPLPTVIFLHGGSGTLREGLPVAKRLTAEGFAVLIVEGAYRSTDGLGHDHVPIRPMQPDDTIDGKPVVQALYDLPLDWYHSVLEDAETVAPLDHGNILVLGFSQGASQAFSMIAHDPDTYRAAGIIGGRFPVVANSAEAFGEFGKKNGRVLLLHGELDTVGNPEENKTVLEQAKVKTEVVLYPGLDHRITDEIVNDFALWAKKLVE